MKLGLLITKEEYHRIKLYTWFQWLKKCLTCDDVNQNRTGAKNANENDFYHIKSLIGIKEVEGKTLSNDKI